jgi:hypothetical protein
MTTVIVTQGIIIVTSPWATLAITLVLLVVTMGKTPPGLLLEWLWWLPPLSL